MTDMIICVFTNLFRVYLLRRFVRIFLGESENSKGKCFLAWAGFYLANTGLYMRFHLAWLNILCNLTGITLILLLYTRSFKMNLFVSCMVNVINIACDTLVTLPFVNYKDGKGFDQIYSVICVFFVLICELLTEKIIGERKNADNIQNPAFILLPSCSIAMLCLLIYTEICTSTGILLISFGFLLLNFLVLYLYQALCDSFQQKCENEVLRQKAQSYAYQLETLVQSEEKVKALRHDMKHHMNELKLMAKSAGNTAIQNYIDHMEEFIENPNEIVSSGNVEIDSVLNYMLHRAKKELQTVNVKVQLPMATAHSFDINIILGNLLENAIEAAGRTDEKRLNVLVQFKQGVLRIEIENSFCGELKEKNCELLTTKEKKELHGIGLKSVRKIVEKYNGIMETFPTGNTFCVKLILFVTMP